MRKTGRILASAVRLSGPAVALAVLALFPAGAGEDIPGDASIWSLDGSLKIKIRRDNLIEREVPSAVLRLGAPGADSESYTGPCTLEGYDASDQLAWSVDCTWSAGKRRYRFEADREDLAEILRPIIEEVAELPATVEPRKARGRGGASRAAERSLKLEIRGRVEVNGERRRFKATLAGKGCLGTAPCPDRGPGNGSGGNGGSDRRAP